MRRFIHRHQPTPAWRAVVLAGFGAALAIGLLAAFTEYSTLALLMAPFGASCVLLFALPAAPLSQPVNVVAGHVVSAAIGLGVFQVLPAGFVASGVAVGLAVAGMVLFRIVHPPAGATALLAATAKGLGFLLFPVLTGSLVLVALAFIYHRLAGHSYPLPVPPAGKT